MSNLAQQLRVLRHGDFRYLWLAQSASVIGDCIVVSLALLPLGYVLAGPLAQALGAVEVLIGGSALACLALAAGLLPRETRMLERLAAPLSGDGAAAEPLPGLAHRS
jgi:hypothetical protein